MLLAFFIIQYWGSPWKSNFNLVIDEEHLSVSGDVQQCSKYGHIIHHGLFSLLAKYHYTKLEHMVTMNSWNVDIQQKGKAFCLGQIILYHVILK